MSRSKMERGRSLALFTVMHFVIDFSCFYILTGVLKETSVMISQKGMLFLLYNFMAFALQVLIGAIMKKETIRACVLTGTVLVFFGLILADLSDKPWTVIVVIALIGLGNACFHIGGEMDSLVFSQGRYTRPGIFVSSGALGVSIGTYMGANHSISIWIIAVVLLVSMIAVALLKEESIEMVEQKGAWSSRGISKHKQKQSIYATIIVLCIVAIAIRSYVGSLIAVKTEWFLWPSIFACIGKASGGIMADRFGVRKTSMASLAISAICLSIPESNVMIRLIGVLLFNMVMPITLYILYEQFIKQPGFAFGLSTLALFLGILPAFFINVGEERSPIIIFILTMAAAGMLYGCLSRKAMRGSTYEAGI